MKHLLISASLSTLTAFSVLAAPASAQIRLPELLGGNSGEGLTVDPKRGVLTMAPLLERTTPAVVNIAVTSTVKSQRNPLMDDPFFRRFMNPNGDDSQQPEERQAESAGSGVIIDASEGYILTNHHVVENADEIKVTLKDSRIAIAELIGSDPKTDIALLKIKERGLTELKLLEGNNSKVGDYVVAIGNPFGLGQTVTSGIVSATGRAALGTGNYEDFIQTDAAINPGNSGGALINTKGELIGINTAIISRSGSSAGVGFAVPAYMASAVVDQLSRYGEVRRGRIGVAIQDITPELADALDLSENKGALISQVQEDSPAERAGLKDGDIITAFNGEPIESSRDLSNAVGFVERGTRNDVTYIRNGRSKTIKIDVEEAPKEETTSVSFTGDADNDNAETNREGFNGAEITNIPSDLELTGGDKGVYIANVTRGSKAHRAGLRKGDVIRAINRTSIDDVDDFMDILDEDDGILALTVQRGRSQIFIAIK